MQNKRKSDKAKWTIVFVLIALLCVGMIFSIVTITQNETSKSVTALNFQIGGLDENGKLVSSDTSTMVTKDFLTLEGLSIVPATGSTVQYVVFYYDEDGKFISADDACLSEYAATAPEGAEKVKIVVDPVNDAEVSFNEIVKYAKMLTIKVSKK